MQGAQRGLSQGGLSRGGLSRRGLGLAIAVLRFVFFAGTANAQQMIDCPAAPTGLPGIPQPAISPQMFSDVCFLNPDPFGMVPPTNLFDDFAWRSFIALVWPAKQGQRGAPDGSLRLDAPQRPAVFETLKSEWEVFQKDGQDPKGWNEYGGVTPCALPGPLAFGDIVLAAFSKFDSVLQATGSAFSGPLISQNGKYVRYATGFNETLFQPIVAGKYFLAKNLANFTPFKEGSIRVKSAWIEMDGIEKPERFHRRQAFVFNRATSQCERKLVGLVALHVVVKTPSMPQWVWATFEHVDNVPGPHASKPFTFNKGDGVPMGDTNPAKCDTVQLCPATPPPAFNVDRINPILGEPPADANVPFSTSDTNNKYRALLAREYPLSPWRNYQLVMTQWPLHPNRPDLNGGPADTFPGVPGIPGIPPTASANAAIETFLQKSDATGCMSCHLHAQKYDYVSSLLTRPFVADASALPTSHVDSLNKVKTMFDGQFQK